LKPKNAIGFEVRNLNNYIKRDVEKSKVFDFCKTTGLHGWAIGYFYENRKKDVFQRDFESHFSIRRSTASNILSCMEKNGLIIRESVEHDARLKKIVLTERAVEIHKMIIKDIYKREERLKKGIDPNDLECFFRVIEKVKANLEVCDD